MKLQQSVQLEITQEEIKEGIICLLDCKRNDLNFNDPEHAKISKLIDHIRKENCILDFVNDKYFLMIDGICFENSIDVLE